LLELNRSREWADVYIESPVTRRALERRALYFVPGVLPLCDEYRLNSAMLSAVAHMAKREAYTDAPRKSPLVGRLAIDSVLKVKPVTYASATGVIELINNFIGKIAPAELLSTADIVACVFSLKNAGEIAKELNLSVSEISSSCGISRPIVESALMRYRMQYSDAAAIHKFFRKKNSEIKGVDWISNILTINEDDFISTDDSRLVMPAIRQIGDDTVSEYVYNWSNLKPAPRTGHPWAIGA